MTSYTNDPDTLHKLDGLAAPEGATACGDLITEPRRTVACTREAGHDGPHVHHYHPRRPAAAAVAMLAWADLDTWLAWVGLPLKPAPPARLLVHFHIRRGDSVAVSARTYCGASPTAYDVPPFGRALAWTRATDGTTFTPCAACAAHRAEEARP